jgi:hypothetical protein
MAVDFGILVVGTILGMLLGGSIIMFLIFAAVSSAKDVNEHTTTKNGLLWSAKYERTHMRTTMGHEPEDW